MARTSRDVYRRPSLVCRKCGKEGFLTSKGLNEHIRENHVRASVKAAYGEKAKSKAKRKTARRRKGRRTDVYRRAAMRCSCGKSFLTGKSMAKHKSRCTGGKRRKGKSGGKAARRGVARRGAGRASGMTRKGRKNLDSYGNPIPNFGGMSWTLVAPESRGGKAARRGVGRTAGVKRGKFDRAFKAGLLIDPFDAPQNLGLVWAKDAQEAEKLAIKKFKLDPVDESYLTIRPADGRGGGGGVARLKPRGGKSLTPAQKRELRELRGQGIDPDLLAGERARMLGYD